MQIQASGLLDSFAKHPSSGEIPLGTSPFSMQFSVGSALYTVCSLDAAETVGSALCLVCSFPC